MAINPRKLMIVGGGSLCSAMVVIMLLNVALRPKEAPVETAKTGVEVMVAAKSLNPGDLLTEKSVKWERWDENKVYDGLVTREQGDDKPVEGKMKRSVVPGEPVTQSAMVSDKDATLLASQLEKGMRAVGVKVTAESSAGGFVTPGDHVDVILSHKVQIDASGPEAGMAEGLIDQNASETILENVAVLAVDQDAAKKDEATVGRTVTLAVTPKQAEVVMLATQMGELSLSLRGLADQVAEAGEAVSKPKAVEMTTDVEVSNILGRLHAQNGSGGRVQNVRIYNSVGMDSRLYAVGGSRPAEGTQTAVAR